MLTLADYLNYIYDNARLEWQIYKFGREPEPLFHDVRLFALKCLILRQRIENFITEHAYRSVLIHCMTSPNTFPDMVNLATTELRNLLERPTALTLVQRTTQAIMITLYNYRNYITKKIKESTDDIEKERLESQQLREDEYYTWLVFLQQFRKNKRLFMQASPYLPYKPELGLMLID